MDVCLQQKDIIQNEFNSVGIYEPIENIIFNITFPFKIFQLIYISQM